MKSCFLLIEVLCCPKQRHDGLWLEMTVNEFNTDSFFLRALPSLASVNIFLSSVHPLSFLSEFKLPWWYQELSTTVFTMPMTWDSQTDAKVSHHLTSQQQERCRDKKLKRKLKIKSAA